MDLLNLKRSWMIAVCVCFLMASDQSYAQSPAQAIPVDRPEAGVTLYGEPDPWLVFRGSTSIDLAPDEKSLVASDDTQIRLFDLEENKVTATVKKKGFTAVHFSPNGDRVYAIKVVQPSYVIVDGRPKEQSPTETKTTLTVFDAKSMDEIDTFRFEGPGRRHLAMGATGRWLALGDDQSILVIDAITGEVEQKVQCRNVTRQPYFALVRDGRVLVYSDGAKVKAIDLTTEEPLSKQDLPIVGEMSNGLSTSADGRWLVSWQNNQVRRFDLTQNKWGESGKLRGYPQNVFYSSDANHLVISTYFAEVANWGMTVVDVSSGSEVKMPNLGYPVDVALKDDGSALYFLGSRKEFKYVPLSKSSRRINFDEPVNQVKSIQGEPHLLAIHGTNSVCVFDLDQRTLGETQSGLELPKAVFFDRDRFFFCCRRNQSLTLASAASEKGGREKRSTLVTNGPVTPGPFDLLDDYFDGKDGVSRYRQGIHLDLCAADDGKHFFNMFDRFVAEYSDGKQKFLDRTVTIQKRSREGKVVEKWQIEFDDLDKNAGVIYWTRCAVSPDGNLAVIGNQVYDVLESRSIADLEIAEGNQTSTEFSPDSKWLLVKLNNQIKILDTENFEVAQEFKGVGSLHASFSEDGKQLVVAEAAKSGFVKLVSCGDWDVLFEGTDTKANRSSVSLLNRGQNIYFGLNDNRIEVWNWNQKD